MKIFKYKKVLACFCALILLFIFLTVPAFAYSNIVPSNFSGAALPSEVTLREDCPVPIDINYCYTYQDFDSYAYITDLYSCTLLPFVFDNSLNVSLNSDYFTDSFGDFGFTGNITPIDFNVESFSSDPSFYLIGDADFSFDNIRYSSRAPSESEYTEFVTFSLRDFYCWDYSFHSRLNSVDSEISLSFDLDDLDFPLHSIDVYYSLAGDSQLNYIKFDASNYPGLLTGEITFSPDLFGYSGDTIVYIYSADIYFWNGLNQPDLSAITSFDFDAHYVFNPFLHNVSFAGSPGGSLPLANYTGWIADAASGFLDFEIYDGFTLGGIFMCIIAFLCAMWFLKLVAGG